MPEPESREARNARIIAEFRENHGKVGAPFRETPIILVHHRGRRSGTERVTPLAYQSVEGHWAVFGTVGGSPTHPDWYRNLVANPSTTVEVGDDTVEVVAREAEGEERTRIWEEQKRLMPTFADYETKAAPRQIPVVVLEPAS